MGERVVVFLGLERDRDAVFGDDVEMEVPVVCEYERGVGGNMEGLGVKRGS
jgi:hypothetical protein